MKSQLVFLLSLLLLQACSIGNLPHNLSRSMMNQEDPEIVRTAAPAYLLMLDALVETYPEDPEFLLSAARLYGAYASVFSNDDVQTKRMALRAKHYAERALCEEEEDLCLALEDSIMADIDYELSSLDEDELNLVYTYASSWASWIQANSDDWNAIADLPKVKRLFTWVLSWNKSYDNGTAQVYMGVLESQLPPALGGKPHIARAHFEKAIEVSEEGHLMAKVLFAQQYARSVFDQELHDKLLNDVINSDPRREGLTLINQLAKQQAPALLAESTEYFE